MARIAVIFDLDGVLIDSYAAHLESWRQLAREMHADITEKQFAKTFGRTSRETIREIFGVTDPAGVRRLDDRKEAIYRELIHDAAPEMPGAVEAVRRLHAAGFRLALGSSAPPENVTQACGGLGLDSFFSAKVTGSDVRKGKPHPQVFQLAAERLGIEPATCVVIEDAPAGIEAAKRAGMRCIALASTHSASTLAGADRLIDSLDELTPELILELL